MAFKVITGLNAGDLQEKINKYPSLKVIKSGIIENGNVYAVLADGERIVDYELFEAENAGDLEVKLNKHSEVDLLGIKNLENGNFFAVMGKDDGGGGSSGGGIFVGFVTNGDSFPTARPDGSALENEDYVRPASTSTFPFTIGDVTFENRIAKAFYVGGTWYLDAGVVQETSETPVHSIADESTKGSESLATTQADINKENVELFDEQDVYGLPVYKTKLADYVWQLEYQELNYSFAKKYAKGGFDFGCTAIYKNGMLGRNLDWLFSKEIEAVVRTQKTIAVCGGISTLTQTAMQSGSAKKSDLKLLPFYVRDGINDRGLACNVNVVPKAGNTSSIPTLDKRNTISALCLCRYILDNFSFAWEACNYIKEHVSIVFPAELLSKGYEAHWMVADKNKCYFLEVVSGVVEFAETNVLTNFRRNGVSFLGNGKVHTPADGGLPYANQGVDMYGTGLERFNLMIDNLANVKDVDTMYSQALTKAHFTKSYVSGNDWFSELTGNGAYGNLTVDSPASAFSAYKAASVAEYAAEGDDEGRRTAGKLWHTTHSSVMDCGEKSLKVWFNETDTNYIFSFRNNIHGKKFVQETKTDVWTIVHNYNDFPTMYIYDDENNSLVPLKVEFVDDHTFKILFSEPVKGYVLVN